MAYTNEHHVANSIPAFVDLKHVNVHDEEALKQWLYEALRDTIAHIDNMLDEPEDYSEKISDLDEKVEKLESEMREVKAQLATAYASALAANTYQPPVASGGNEPPPRGEVAQ